MGATAQIAHNAKLRSGVDSMTVYEPNVLSSKTTFEFYNEISKPIGNGLKSKRADVSSFDLTASYPFSQEAHGEDHAPRGQGFNVGLHPPMKPALPVQI
jgi:hypothetical protein